MPMKRLFSALFFAAFLFAQPAQAQDVLVVTACGSAPPSYANPGAVLPLTVDTNGKLCTTLAGGGLSGAGLAGQAAFWNPTNVLAGDASFLFTVPGQVALALGSITTNLKALSITGTFNAAGTTFDAPLLMNITNTASAAGSLLIDSQVGGNSQFNVTVAGGINAANGTNTYFQAVPNVASISGAPSGAAISASLNLGSFSFNFNPGSDASVLNVATNSINAIGFSQGGLSLPNVSGSALAWSSSSGLGHSVWDTALYRDGAAGVVALTNYNTKTSATSFRVYNTTDTLNGGAPTNFERGVSDWTSNTNVYTLGTQAGGTGTARNVALLAGNATSGTNFSYLQLSDNGTAFIIQTVQGGTGAALNLQFGSSLGTITMANNFDTLGLSTLNRVIMDHANGDAGYARIAPKVIAFNDGAGANANGFMQWQGEQRVTADVTNATTTLATITGLSVNVQAGRTYCFVGELSWTDAAAGGLQLAVSGTSTATNIIYDGYIVDSAANGIKGNAQATALGGVVASAVTTGTAGHARLSGCDTVNAAGTLLLQFAENTSNATATTIKRGSYFYVYDSP